LTHDSDLPAGLELVVFVASLDGTCERCDDTELMGVSNRRGSQ